MAFLLDTHALIWWLEDAGDLSEPSRRLLEDPNAEIYCSAASCYEIGWKVAIGRLSPRPSVRAACAMQGIVELAITAAHAERAASLAPIHRDPWDRLLVAQALENSLVVITRDDAIAALGATVIW
jgi:PIN domain nuclease of toxin-antitoxin system